MNAKDWISVKERLPEPGRIVLAHFPGVPFTGLCQLEYETDYGGEWRAWLPHPYRGLGDLPLDYRSTPDHWMPLPPPPTEKL